MKIALACDHGGYELKEKIKEYLMAKHGYIPVTLSDGDLNMPSDKSSNSASVSAENLLLDLGTYSTESVDYPNYGKACGEAVASGAADKGIVVCGTGIGISIAANKVKGVRCALCTSVEMAELTRKHNDANILALGGRTTPPELALPILEAWLTTEFEGGRHQRRVDLLNEM